MPSSRRSSKRPWGEHRELDLDRARAGTRPESGPDGDWTVRSIAASEKTYTCPGCRREIPPGTAHVVTWRRDHVLGDDAAVEDRRHWHPSCWQNRSRRR